LGLIKQFVRVMKYFCCNFFRPPKDLYYDYDQEKTIIEKEEEKKKQQARQSI